MAEKTPKIKLYAHRCGGCGESKPLYSLDDGETINPDEGQRCKKCALREWKEHLGKTPDEAGW